ncbi:hypothetical protein BaRGS_00030467 [Batillaria attramentaria]|uniref:EF-hand domain-containing family member C2 n=1 Tax=Batillaria attramentaria TaxID=370345 RepID=A0ABD0JUI3_9CAEN
MSLPFLPGNTFNPNLGKTKFHKSHHFDVANDVYMLVGEHKPGIGGEPLPFQKPKPSQSKFPKGEDPKMPAWVAFDRQVLSFDAYFMEASTERREEQYRMRYCKIYFYLEDDTIQVLEPRWKCSGLPQGTIIKRHRIPRPPPNDGDFYTIQQFNVGEEINLYSKVFKITDCDQFTRNFLTKMGIRIGPTQAPPEDPYQGSRKTFDETMQPLRPYERYDTLKQFLEHDRHVLRFYCYWDDTDNLYGDPRQFVLHFFLSDDTIEIREVIPVNSGRDAVGMFLRRARLPKNVEALKQHGADTNRTVLNVFGPMGHGRRLLLDSLKTGAVHTDFYKDHDLTIGAVINVWGRKFVLCDCDEFTREYYRTKYGITEFTPLKYSTDKGPDVEREWPPYNGFGAEEDSLANCKNLMPKAPQADFIKFMMNDRQGLESNVLRFLARMETEHPIDKGRRFIISYFLRDDTILVFEPPVRNSGVIGGKFIERGRIKKPHQMRFSTQLSEYYLAPDLYFPNSNMQKIMEKVRNKLGKSLDDVRTFFSKTNPSASGVCSYSHFHDLLCQYNLAGIDIVNPKYTGPKCLMDGSLTDHEVMTLARNFADQSQQVGPDVARLISIAQVELRKRNFEGFHHLMDSLKQQDKTKSGYMPPEAVRNALLSHHVPLPDDIVKGLFEVATVDEKGDVAYVEFLNRINWKQYPVPAIQYQPGHPNQWEGMRAKNEITSVNYVALLDAIFGESASAQ